MLYLSTRNSEQTYTAARVLTEGRAPDGGLFVPYYTSAFPREELDRLLGMRFNEVVAQLLNIQFQCRLTEHDVRLCVGRNPVRITQLNNRIFVGELWHNLDGSYSRLVQNLARHICPEATVAPGSWIHVAVGTCVVFGIVSELMARDLVSFDKKPDVSLVSGDLSLAMGCWYARRWGLPLGDILCCCNENNGVWNLLANGSLRTDGISIPTRTPEADVSVPASLERLIRSCGGVGEVERYVEKCRKGATYYPEDSLLHALRQGMFVSVVSTPRMLNTIPNAYATLGYLFSPYSALAYGGLMDYRAKTGSSRPGLILADRSPLAEEETVAQAMGISPEELKEKL